MNPEEFLNDSDIPPLIKALSRVFTKYSPLNVLQAIGIDCNFIGGLSYNQNPNMFSLQLVAAFQTFSISRKRLDYHPMMKLLEHLNASAEIYNLEDSERGLITKLLKRGNNNLQALLTCSAVARIESPQDNGIGTGFLVRENLLATCNHVFSKSQVKQAWVRFNYKAEDFPLDKDLFEIDINSIKPFHRPDFALVKIKGKPKQNIVNLNNKPLAREESIRLIHCPQGKPLEISDQGNILQIGDNYLYHNLKTAEGSSGAPIFDDQWKLIGIHRGKPDRGEGLDVAKGSREGIPVHAFQELILRYKD